MIGAFSEYPIILQFSDVHAEPSQLMFYKYFMVIKVKGKDLGSHLQMSTSQRYRLKPDALPFPQTLQLI